MVKIIEREGNAIAFSKLITICPRNYSKDESVGEIIFKPGAAAPDFIKNALIECINLVEGQQEWMEIVPIRILDYCIKKCVISVKSLEAAPENMIIGVTFRGKKRKA